MQTEFRVVLADTRKADRQAKVTAKEQADGSMASLFVIGRRTRCGFGMAFASEKKQISGD
jgi:hypothetical protein